MATKLTKAVVREIEMTDINGVTGPVVASFGPSGIEFRGKGKQRKVFVPYKSMTPVLPANAPAKFTANPWGWLVEGTAPAAKDDKPAT